MSEIKFNPKRLEKLNNPERLREIPPEYVLKKLHQDSYNFIIEIGAGTAFFSKAFYDLFRPEMLYACDLSDTMIEWMQENIVPDHKNIVPVKTGEITVPLEDSTADLLFMINLHHELKNPVDSLKEAFRLLSPQGSFFIVDWKKKEMPQGPPIHIRCSTDDVKSQMETAGFSDITIYDDLEKQFLIVGKKA